MSNVNTDGLPPEMQERIAQIIEGAKQKAIAQHQHNIYQSLHTGQQLHSLLHQ